MCVPIIDNAAIPELSDEDLKKLQAAQGGATTPGATGGTTTPTSGPDGPQPDGSGPIPGKSGIAGGGDKGMDASGGLSPVQLLQQQVQAQQTAAEDQQFGFQQAITLQAAGFQSVAAGIMQSQQMASDALRAGFLDLTDVQKKALDAADQLRKNTGQGSRKPNYGAKLKENAKASRGGITSTMLTGVGGVPNSALPLGKASLLGS